MSCDNQINKTDLENAKLDAITFGEIATSKQGSTSGGADIDSSTNRFGNVSDTVTGRLKKMGYLVPVTYTSGIVFSANDNVKTVDESGIVYAPLPSALPFTTTTWGADADKFFVVQGVTSDQIISDLSQAYEFATVAEMTSSNIAFPVGKKLNTIVNNTTSNAGGASYVVSDTAVADGYGNHALSGGNIAELQVGRTANSLQFGVIGNGGNGDTDDTLALQALLSVGGRINIPSGRTYVLSSPLIVSSNSYIYGGGTIDVSRVTGTPYATSAFEIANKNNITIDGMLFTGRANDEDVVTTLQNSAVGVSIDQQTPLDSSRDIYIINNYFTDMSYSCILGEARENTTQTNWVWKNNKINLNGVNHDPETGGNIAFNIIGIYGSSSDVSACDISNNTMIMQPNYLGIAYKLTGIRDSVVTGNIVTNISGNINPSSSGILEISMQNSVFKGNITDAETQYGTVFTGCENLKVSDCFFKGDMIIAPMERRADILQPQVSIDISNTIINTLAFVSAEFNTDYYGTGLIDISDCTIENIQITDAESVSLSNVTSNTIRIESQANGKINNVRIKGGEIQDLVYAVGGDSSSKVIVDDVKINILGWSTTQGLYEFSNCEIRQMGLNHPSSYAHFYRCKIAGTDNASTETITNISNGTYEGCDFYCGVGQVSGYVCTIGNNAKVRNNRYNKKTITGDDVSLTGSILVATTNQSSELYEEEASFDNGFETYSLYDPNDGIKKNIAVAIPTTGDYKRYNRITNFNARNVGDDIGWVCVTTGTGGSAVFRSLGKIT